jgi:hypothetical protein
MSEENVRFCPLLTVVRAGQVEYGVCKINCVFYLDDECAFITTARLLKRSANPRVVDTTRKVETNES